MRPDEEGDGEEGEKDRGGLHFSLAIFLGGGGGFVCSVDWLACWLFACGG